MPERSPRPGPTALEAAQAAHAGIFITGPGRAELRDDSLPAQVFGGHHLITESLGNSVCSSDQKAITQFTTHARIPSNATQVALGHETVQRLVAVPAGMVGSAGDVVLITPGLSSRPVDPDTYQADPEAGVLAALGYSFRYAAGLRRFSALPSRAGEVVREHGLGELVIPVPAHRDVSLATLAHAEPFACCYGALSQMFTRDADGGLQSGVPAGSRVAMLSGTGRMAMITLAIFAGAANGPRHILITGSAAKLAEVARTAALEQLQRRGVEVVLVDRGDEAALDLARAGNPYDIAITYYASQPNYDLAAGVLRAGGNLNNFAGASDPELFLPMRIGPVADAAGATRATPEQWLQWLLHPVAPHDTRRQTGLAQEPVVALLGFAADDARLTNLLRALPPRCRVTVGREADRRHSALAAAAPALRFEATPPYTDVLIAGTGAAAAAAYAAIEPELARDAAVGFVDGDTEIRIRSRHVHYMSRHQICGPTVPYFLTNTSEPLSADLARQARQPIDFDWLVRRVAGLRSAVALIEDVGRHAPFGSHFVLTQLEALPYVDVDAAAFRAAADQLGSGVDARRAAAALRAAAAVLDGNGGAWSRAVEEALYRGYGAQYPL